MIFFEKVDITIAILFVCISPFMFQDPREIINWEMVLLCYHQHIKDTEI